MRTYLVKCTARFAEDKLLLFKRKHSLDVMCSVLIPIDSLIHNHRIGLPQFGKKLFSLLFGMLPVEGHSCGSSFVYVFVVWVEDAKAS